MSRLEARVRELEVAIREKEQEMLRLKVLPALHCPALFNLHWPWFLDFGHAQREKQGMNKVTNLEDSLRGLQRDNFSSSAVLQEGNARGMAELEGNIVSAVTATLKEQFKQQSRN